MKKQHHTLKTNCLLHYRIQVVALLEWIHRMQHLGRGRGPMAFFFLLWTWLYKCHFLPLHQYSQRLRGCWKLHRPPQPTPLMLPSLGSRWERCHPGSLGSGWLPTHPKKLECQLLLHSVRFSLTKTAPYSLLTDWASYALSTQGYRWLVDAGMN